MSLFKQQLFPHHRHQTDPSNRGSDENMYATTMTIPMILSVTVIFWKEAAESEVISSILVAVSTRVDHQDSISHWIALSGVGVVPFGQQG